MEYLLIATIAAALILLASMISVELGLSVAIIEIVLGVIGGNFLGLHTTPWMDFLAGFASIVLTFLAGAEVDPDLLREKWRESLLIGGISFLAPFLAAWAFSHAVLPAFLFGLAMARILARNWVQQQRLRVVAFPLLTPFFFLKSGMNISLPAVVANFGWVAALFGVKMITKIAGVFPLARRFVPRHSWYTTLLMSTGLTFGTISSLYGLNAGILSQAQFSVLVTVVIGTAIIPTLIAQRFFSPWNARSTRPPEFPAHPAAPDRQI